MSGAPVTLSGGGVLAVVGLAAAAYLVWKGPALLKSAGQGIAAAADAVNPLNPNNVVATGVNAVGGAIVTDPAGAGKNADGSWSLGGWAFDILNPDTAQAVRDASGTVNTGGATGSW